MNALTPNRAAQKAAKSEFEKYAKSYAESTAQAILALIMNQMYSKWGCSPATCRRRLNDITSMLNAPAVFGKEIHDRDYIRWCKNTLNIDIEQEVKLKVKVDYV